MEASENMRRGLELADEGSALLVAGDYAGATADLEQAVAIGLSEARRAGAKVPTKRRSRKKKT